MLPSTRVKGLPDFPFTKSKTCTKTRGPFLKRPGKLTGPVSYFEIEVSRKVGCVLTSNEVHFVSLAENFTVYSSTVVFKSLKLPSGMENKTA